MVDQECSTAYLNVMATSAFERDALICCSNGGTSNALIHLREHGSKHDNNNWVWMETGICTSKVRACKKTDITDTNTIGDPTIYALTQRPLLDTLVYLYMYVMNRLNVYHISLVRIFTVC
jgi:hypothetical protein